MTPDKSNSENEVIKIIDSSKFNRTDSDPDYQNIRSQIKNMIHDIRFGVDVSVLVITDRLYGCAKGLYEYLRHSPDISVDLVDNKKAAEEMLRQKPYNFLIIVGYLEKRMSYQIIKPFKQINKYSSVIMYASLDGMICSVCSDYEIEHRYHRRLAVDGFLGFMQVRYIEDMLRFNSAHPIETDKWQVWQSNLKLYEELVKAKAEEVIVEDAQDKKLTVVDMFLMGIVVIISVVGLTLSVLYPSPTDMTNMIWNSMKSISNQSSVLEADGEKLAVGLENNFYESIQQDHTLPKPDRKPILITADINKVVATDEALSIQTIKFKDTEPPVVYLLETTYHRGFCQVYEANTNGDYSDPHWLNEVIFDFHRCTKCLPDEQYDLYKEAIYISDRNDGKALVDHLRIVVLVEMLIIVLSLCWIFRRFFMTK